jgi:hypothetical protein
LQERGPFVAQFWHSSAAQAALTTINLEVVIKAPRDTVAVLRTTRR